MKNKTAFSKWLQVLVLLTFLLPFFPKGCEPKKAEEAPHVDSIQVAKDTAGAGIAADSSSQLAIDSTNEDTTKVKTTSVANNEDKDNDESPSEMISKKFKFLTPVLRPSGNYSGIGFTIESIQYFMLFGTGLAFLLFVIGLIVKLKDYNSILHLVNDLGLIFLLFAYGGNPLNQHPLWGYWVCLAFVIVMVVYDTVRQFRSKKKPNKKK